MSGDTQNTTVQTSSVAGPHLSRGIGADGPFQPAIFFDSVRQMQIFYMGSDKT